jgi:high-affinity nickel permease
VPTAQARWRNSHKRSAQVRVVLLILFEFFELSLLQKRGLLHHFIRSNWNSGQNQLHLMLLPHLFTLHFQTAAATSCGHVFNR